MNCAETGIEVVTERGVQRVEGKSGESVRLHATQDGVDSSSKARTSCVAGRPHAEHCGDWAGVGRRRN